MTARPVFLFALCAGCFDPRLGAAPFACVDAGTCPRGYRCVQQFCIANGQPSPPTLVSAQSSADTEPVPVYDGQSFGVFFKKEDGLYFMRQDGTSDPAPIVPTQRGSQVSFAAAFDPTVDRVTGTGPRYAVAVVENKDSGNTVSLYGWMPTASPQKPPGRQRIYVDQNPLDRSFGYGAPSLFIHQEGTSSQWFLSYPHVWPNTNPTLKSNVVCQAFPGNIPQQVTNPNDCSQNIPFDSIVNSNFASEALLVITSVARILVWRDSVAGVMYSAGTTAARFNTPVVHVRRGVAFSNALFLVAQIANVSNDMGEQNNWNVLYGESQNNMSPLVLDAVAFAFSNIVPDIATPIILRDQLSFTVCSQVPTGGDHGGELVLQTSFPNLPDTKSICKFVPRLSHAEILSCRISVSPTNGDIAVSWLERFPPSARSYFEIVPRLVPGQDQPCNP